MENESLKLYELGEWILYAIGDYDLGIGQIVSKSASENRRPEGGNR